MNIFNKRSNPKRLRVIKTARSLFSINFGAKLGYFPLIKAVEPSEKIRKKFQVIQNRKTGMISIGGDYRWSDSSSADFETVITWTYYYPYTFKSPFAAYLIPKNIKVGERVFVKDLIEDYVGSSWNQGNAYRLKSCEAIWDGTDLIIQYHPERSVIRYIG